MSRSRDVDWDRYLDAPVDTELVPPFTVELYSGGVWDLWARVDHLDDVVAEVKILEDRFFGARVFDVTGRKVEL